MRRTAKLGTALLVTAGTAVVLAGCGSSNNASTSPSSTTPAATSAPSTVATVSKAVIIQKGDAICKAANATIGDQPKSSSTEDVKAFLVLGVTTNRDSLKQFQALGTPDTDADKFADVIAKQGKLLDVIEAKEAAFAKDPSTMSTDTELLAAQTASRSA
ncbi:MAG: hypothetical protein H0X35_09455, partial [Pseudonocardiales bacterium]|nr:hypothetical protein [Pseudonocardiales bacterium]